MTPANFPELNLPEGWRREFHELMGTGLYNQTEALAILSERYGGVSRTCLRYHIFSSDKEFQKNSRLHQWCNKKADPRLREYSISYARRYMTARNHITETLERCYEKVGNEPQELRDLSALVQEECGIRFKPQSLLGLAKRYEQTTGKPLLELVIGHDPPCYQLHKNP